MNTTDWSLLRDGIGKSAEWVPEMLTAALSSKRRRAMDRLSDRLFLPGVLYSAAPMVIRTLIRFLPASTPERQTDILECLHSLSQSARAEDLSEVERSSRVVTDAPYGSFEALRGALIEELDLGKASYLEIVSAQEQPGLRHALAADLLSYPAQGDLSVFQYVRRIVLEWDREDSTVLDVAAAHRVAPGTKLFRDLVLEVTSVRSGQSGELSVALAAIAWLAVDEGPSSTVLALLEAFMSAFGIIPIESIIRNAGTEKGVALFGQLLRFDLPDQLLATQYAFELLQLAFGKVQVSYKTINRQGGWHFHSRASPTAVGTLSAVQKTAVQALVHSDSFWKGQSNLLSLYGLPESRPNLALLLSRP